MARKGNASQQAQKAPDKPRLKPLSLAPLTVDEALEALLKTPPPPVDEDQPPQHAVGKKKAAKKR